MTFFWVKLCAKYIVTTHHRSKAAVVVSYTQHIVSTGWGKVIAMQKVKSGGEQTIKQTVAVTRVNVVPPHVWQVGLLAKIGFIKALYHCIYPAKPR